MKHYIFLLLFLPIFSFGQVLINPNLKLNQKLNTADTNSLVQKNTLNATVAAQNAVISTKLDNAQNGLTKTANTVELGGGLLKNTTIDINSKYLAFFGKEFFISDTWGKTNYTHSGISFKSTFYNTSNPNNDWGMGFIQSVFGKNFKIDLVTDRPLIEQTWSNNPSYATSGYCINLGTDLSNNADGIQIWGGKGLLNSPLELLMQISPTGNVGVGIPFHTFPSEKLEINGNIKASGTVSGSAFLVNSGVESKQNIENLDSQKSVNIIKSLRPVKFEYKNEYASNVQKGRKQFGFVAEQVEKLLPEMVHRMKVQKFDSLGKEYKTMLADTSKQKKSRIEAYKKQKAQADSNYVKWNNFPRLQVGGLESTIVSALQNALLRIEALEAKQQNTKLKK